MKRIPLIATVLTTLVIFAVVIYKYDKDSKMVRYQVEQIEAQYPLLRTWHERAITVDLKAIPVPYGYQRAQPQAQNAEGQIIGSFTFDADGAYHVWKSHAFLWDQGKVRKLNALPGDKISQAVAINNGGEIVGYSMADSFLGGFPKHAVCWISGKVYDLGKGFTVGLNDKGDIIGLTAEVGSVEYIPNHALLWSHGHRIDLKTLGGITSYANSINNAGQVVGKAGTPQQTVLDAYLPGSTVHTHAFLWEKGKMYDLNNLIPSDSGWVLEEAVKIDETGKIAGNGKLNNQPHPFLLTPAGVGRSCGE